MSLLDGGDDYSGTYPREIDYGRQGWENEWSEAFFEDAGAEPPQRVAAMRRVEAASKTNERTAHFCGYEWDLLPANDAEWIELYAEIVEVRIVVA